MVLPRYFVPRAGGEAQDVSADIAHVIDTFTLRFGRSSAEWIVGLDAGGSLAVRPAEPHDALPASLRKQISYHEVSGSLPRDIELESLFVFEMRLLEQAPDSPGVNDPLFLYGALVGPLVCATAKFGPVRRIEGQLTVTRGDLLAGLVGGAAWAFRYPDANHGRTAYTLGLLAGAARHADVQAGRGAVLIYPLLGVDADIYAMAPGNEDIVSRVLYDVLFAWWTDAARDAPPALREAESLPVPSRSQHAQRLVREGFEIKRNTAVRTRTGWAGALPGFLGEERRRLPPETDCDGFLDLAAEALVNAREWPSPAVVALHGRVKGARQLSSPPPVIAGAQTPAGPAPATGPVPDWMQGFIADHKQARSPRLTPGPDNPSAPRVSSPLEGALAAKTVEVLHYLEGKFDAPPPPRKRYRRKRRPEE